MGPVQAQEYVELQSKSHVTCDVYYKTLEMHGRAAGGSSAGSK
ncbi:MAG: polymer-forming cytoskeletal protein [Sulfuricella sp.]